ncbi:hypothetical protein DPMN_080285, partial [Dreissena polymorpha]
MVRCLRSKAEKGVAICAGFLLIAAIALPLYINTLKPKDDVTSTGSIASQTSSGRRTTTSDGPYVSNGSLTFVNRTFVLNGSVQLRIISGAIHYFRTVAEGWEDRLRKLKACGMNTVETYVPWNLHEEEMGKFNFDGMLNVTRFLNLAHQLGLFVIFRPGPYICSEWDFGGLPGWLLNDPNMEVRSNYPRYIEAVERYFCHLLPLVRDLQYSKGGPIIAFQIENEFGSYSTDVAHLHKIKEMYEKHGLTELYLTSDNMAGQSRDVFYQHALPTANFKDYYKEGTVLFDQIRRWSPNFPIMVTEFWTGWFDHWLSPHSGLDVEEYARYLREILKSGASLNFYMFHGGTNFGFMNGANKDSFYSPDVTSYDYDALLTEKGDITPKYLKTRELLLEYVYKPAGQTLPEIPGNQDQAAYGNASVSGYIRLDDYLTSVTPVSLASPMPMEMLNISGRGHGQSYGYVLYRANIPRGASQIAFANLPTDRAQIFLNDQEVATMDWNTKSLLVSLPRRPTDDGKNTARLDILVENHGRVNYGTRESGVLNNERKGIRGDVTVDGRLLKNLTAYPLEFKTTWSSWTDWNAGDNGTVPGIFNGSVTVSGQPKDTFLFMKDWGKGIVFINDFNLGRYWSVGPQQTLYVPAAILREGDNQ